jgi:hypothetical protein
MFDGCNGRKQLMFASSFDGPWDTYIDDFECSTSLGARPTGQRGDAPRQVTIGAVWTLAAWTISAASRELHRPHPNTRQPGAQPAPEIRLLKPGVRHGRSPRVAN